MVQKEKRKGEFDYDLRFLEDGALEYYGDLKASNIAVDDSPGNDAEDFFQLPRRVRPVLVRDLRARDVARP